MASLTAKRTLVKSPPELWSELSEVDRLAKHLEAFGDITITKLEPEHAVAWEGETASGTVSIEPSGWGTKVTMTAQVDDGEVAAEPEPEPQPPVDPGPVPKPRFFARMFARPSRRAQEMQAEPTEPEPEPAPEPPAPDDGAADRAQAALDGALEALGSAHHRPFSRG